MIDKHKLYFPTIDGIRAIAIMAVVLFHLELSLFSGGYVGVDIFFVVSGYLISKKLFLEISAGQFSLSRFYVARLRRLFPALLTTIFLTLIAGILLYSPDALIRLSGSAIAGVLSLANIRYWKDSGYFDFDSSSKPLLHLWSLSIEEQFYLLWPLLLLLLFKVCRTNKERIISVCCIGFLSLFASQLMLEQYPSTAFYWMPFRVYEFALGGILANVELKYRAHQNSSYRWQTLIACIGLSLIAFSIFSFEKSTPFPGWNSLVPCVGTLMLISARESFLLRILIANKLMLGIGRISYSLYLVHWPIWVLLSFWYFSEFSFLHKFYIFILTMLAGMALYFLVEKRYRYAAKQAKSKNRKNPSNFFFMGLTLASFFILALSAHIRSNNGWPHRSSQNHTLNTMAKSDLKCTFPNGDKVIQDCYFSQKEKPQKTVLLIGDSHSMNLRRGLEIFGIKNQIGFHSYSVAACPPLIDIRVHYQGSKQAEPICLSSNDSLLALMASDRYDIVMLSARWMWYYEHQSYYVSEQPENHYLVNDEVGIMSADSSRVVWQQSLLNTIKYIEKHNKKVILFSQPPLLSEGIGECNKHAHYFIDAQKDKIRCATKIPYSNIIERLNFTNKYIQSLASKTVLPIISSNSICDSIKKKCNALKPNGLLYYDESHLSNLGSLYLIDSFSEEIRSFIVD